MMPGVMARKKQPPPEPTGPPRWRVPEQCANCGALVEQAIQSRADQPQCRFCSEPLPCEALPPPAPPPTALQGMMGGFVQSAMDSAMAQQQQMSQQWMNQLSQPGALAAMNDPYIRGRGTVTAFQDLAAETPEGRLYLVSLDVRVAGGVPFSTQVSTPVPQDAWGKLAPGVEVAIRSSPINQGDVKVDWRDP